MTMPKTFKIGDTADCQINKAPARLTWRDAKTLVIEPDVDGTLRAQARTRDLCHPA
jgi:hypothetical protein